MEHKNIVSPCISVCKTDPISGFCYGCGRTNDEKTIVRRRRIHFENHGKRTIDNTSFYRTTDQPHPKNQ